jgi:hypothetical protein
MIDIPFDAIIFCISISLIYAVCYGINNLYKRAKILWKLSTPQKESEQQ